MTVPSPAAPATDEDLAARAAAGDEPAFETLVARYEERAFGLACRLVGPGSDAQDVLQDAFLSVYRNLRTFRGAARFSTWLFRIVTNAALMQRRARRRRPADSLEEYLPRFDDTGRHLGQPAELEAAAHAEERLDRRLLAERAYEGIERLPDLYREAFVLRDLEDLTTAEVAEVLGVSAEVVRQRVHRARLMLRGYLADAAGARR